MERYQKVYWQAEQMSRTGSPWAIMVRFRVSMMEGLWEIGVSFCGR